jgi:nitroimidazol reductase NimA-like FMN-containing flavoprotein (pyridoxamine 5'-phosphate oxidase superfamily)
VTTELDVSGRPNIEELPPATCWSLVADEPVGRVVFVDGGQPIALPVNHVVEDGEVFFQSTVGSKLDKALREPGTVVGFEVDSYDPETRSGWSVLLKGTIHPVTGTVTTAHLDRLSVTPWADLGEDGRWIRIEAAEVTGRRVVG